jgi:hypothetical protein
MTVNTASTIFEANNDRAGPTARRPDRFRDSDFFREGQQKLVDKLRKETIHYFVNLQSSYKGDVLKFAGLFAAIPSQDFTAEELVGIVSTLGFNLRQLSDPQCHDIVAANFDPIEDALLEKIDGLTGENAVTLLDALARIPLRPSVHFMQALENKLTIELSKSTVFLNKDLVFALNAFKHLHIRPSEKFMAAWEKKVATVSRGLTARNVSEIFEGYAAMRMRPGSALVEALEKRIVHILPRSDRDLGVEPYAKPIDLTSIMGSLAILDSLELCDKAPQIAQTIDTALRPLSARNFDDGNIHQLHKARLWFDMPTVFEMPDSDNIASKAEDNFARFLIEPCGFDVLQTSDFIEALKHTPDIEVRIPTNKGASVSILIEIDGPTHFLYVPDEQTGRYVPDEINGKTAFQSAMIHKFTPEKPLLRLPVHIAEEMMDRRATSGPQIAQGLVGKMVQYGPGVYYAYTDNGHVMLNDIPVRRARSSEAPKPEKVKAPEEPRHYPVTAELLQSLDSVAARSGGRIILRTPRNLTTMAGFALGSKLPGDPGILLSAETPLSQMQEIIAGEDYISNSLTGPGAGQRKPTFIASFLRGNVEPQSHGAPAPAESDQWPKKKRAQMPLDTRASVMAYFSGEEFFDGISGEFRDVWEDRMAALPEKQALSVKDLFKVLESVTKNIRNAKYPANREQAKDYLAAHMQVWERLVIARLPHVEKAKTTILNILETFQDLGIKPSPEFCEMLQGCAEKHMQVFEARDLYTMLYAMAKLGIEPTKSFLGTWAQRAVSDDISLINATEDPLRRANILWSAAVMHALSGHESMLRIGKSAHRSLAGIKNLTTHPQNKDPRQLVHACLWFDCDVLGPVPENRKYDGAFVNRIDNIFKASVSVEISPERQISELRRWSALAFRHCADDREVLVEVDVNDNDDIYVIRKVKDTPDGNTAYGLDGFGVLQSAVICKVEPRVTLFRIMGGFGADQGFLGLEDTAKTGIAKAIVDRSRNNGTSGAYAVVFNRAGQFDIAPIPVHAAHTAASAEPAELAIA